MKGKRKEGKKGEERGKKREKSIRGGIMTKPDIKGGKKDIFFPNLYHTYLEKKKLFRKGGGGRK